MKFPFASVTGFRKEMAKAKKTRSARRARRYRRKYRKWKRRNRRYRGRARRNYSKTEIKSVSGTYEWTFDAKNVLDSFGNRMLNFYPGYCIYIGYTNSETACFLSVDMGVQGNQRIGYKISPVRLRLTGCFSLTIPENVVSLPAPNFWQIRMLVYQVVGGNGMYSLSSTQYHPLAPTMATEWGGVPASQLPKLFYTYGYDTIASDGSSNFTEQQWASNNAIGRMPLRRGIGKLFRILYKKTFWINIQKNPIKQFRIKTRCPRTLVWNEDREMNSNTYSAQTYPNNGIYVLFVVQPGSFQGDLNPKLEFVCNADLFFNDK